MAYHLRVTSTWDSVKSGLITDFINKFGPSIYVFSEEVSDKGVIHIHGHLEYTGKPPASSTMSDLFKRYLLSGKYYHQPLKKDIKNNLLYVLKDLNIKSHNLSETEYDELITETVAINDDKKKNTRDKLFELYKIWFYIQRPKCEFKVTIITDLGDELTTDETELCYFGTYLNDVTTIALFINDLYVNEWKKEPPLAHLNGYVLYIATLMNKEIQLESLWGYYNIYSFYMRRY